MRNLNYYINDISNNNSLINFWLTLTPIIIAIISIIISTGFAWKSYLQEQKEVYQNKKETLFDFFNDFLLSLETIANAKDYGISKYHPKDIEIDIQCLEAIGKIHCFSQINNLLPKNSNKLNIFLDKLLSLSNDAQDARKIKESEKQLVTLKIIDERLKSLRTDILKEISNKKFFKENKKKN